MVQLAYWVGGELEAVGGLFVEIDCAGVLGGDLEGKMMIVCLCFLSVFVSWFVGFVGFVGLLGYLLLFLNSMLC